MSEWKPSEPQSSEAPPWARPEAVAAANEHAATFAPNDLDAALATVNALRATIEALAERVAKLEAGPPAPTEDVARDLSDDVTPVTPPS